MDDQLSKKYMLTRVLVVLLHLARSCSFSQFDGHSGHDLETPHDTTSTRRNGENELCNKKLQDSYLSSKRYYIASPIHSRTRARQHRDASMDPSQAHRNSVLDRSESTERT